MATSRKNQTNEKQLLRFRFMAMSKLIGIVAFGFLATIVIYSLYEMHRSQIYDALPQLIMSAFAFAAVYAGFYLTMAKVEHIEEEKTKRQKELKALERAEADDMDIERKKQEIADLTQRLGDILAETSQYTQ